MNTEHPDRRRETLQAYLLNTLSDADRTRVESQLESDPEWRRALEVERAALDELDQLPDEASTRDLTASVLRRLDTEAEKKRRPFAVRFAAVFTVAAAIAAVFAIMYLSARAGESRRRHVAVENMKQIALALTMYANDDPQEKYPPLAPYDDVWMFDISVLYPKFLNELDVLVSPELPDSKQLVAEIEALAQKTPVDWERITRIAAISYAYPSWAVRSAEDVERMVAQREQLARAQYDTDIDAEDKPLYRLRQGIERFFITDINNPGASAKAQSTLPVLVETAGVVRERVFSEGANVLFLDGHVETVGAPAPEAPRSNVVDGLIGLLSGQ